MTPITENQHLTDQPARPDGYVMRIPKPNWQVSALLLIALIAGIQTIQLARLKGNVAPKTSATTSTPSVSASAGSSSGLESQVGGC